MVGVVTAAHGAMGSVLVKLSDFLSDKSGLTLKEKKQIVFLTTELVNIRAVLEEISDAENPDLQDKIWAGEARELSYDIEDIIDESRFGLESKSNNKPRGFEGLVKWGKNLLTTTTNQHGITKFEEIKRRVTELVQRRSRYMCDTLPTPSNTPLDIRLVAQFNHQEILVGIDRPRDELIQLMDEESADTHQLKVFSIVGFGGLGKTTLASQIYSKLKKQYHCQAFLCVSQRPDMMKFLRTILSRVGFIAPLDANLETWDVHQLIEALREFLLDNEITVMLEYFIVIDDIWDFETWEIIRCALPENRNSSRVITTTRNETVAIACCGGSRLNVHRMKPLSDQDSRKLLLKRVFDSEDACPPHLEETAAKILRKCGGLPLAIISASRQLSMNPNKWDDIFESRGSSKGLEDMRQILNLSYIDLPNDLKTCMLYMGIYPRDYTISKYDLTKQWIAEGFLSNHRHGIDLGDVANSCFNELINRSMIQPTKTDYNGEVVSCRVHDMMLDLIRHNAREENFMTAIDDIKDIAVQQRKIRRLALHLDGLDDDRVVDAHAARYEHWQDLVPLHIYFLFQGSSISEL